MKLAVVGGGSTYTPELVDGLARLGSSLQVSELALVDPSRERLELVAGVSQRIFQHWGHGAVVTAGSDLDEAVDGADAVLLQLRVGGQAARSEDETWPLECGCVGQETTGAGGLAKALRTVPVVLDIAERVRDANPDSWIVDFTNPVGIVTRALLNEGHRAIGLCNVAIGFQRWFAEVLHVTPREVELDHVGLNHLTWEREVRVAGVDRLPELLDRRGDEIAARLELPTSLILQLGVVPSYYLRYFYAHDNVVRELLSKPSRAAEVAAIEQRLLELYGDPTLDTKPPELEQRGGAYYSEAAVALVSRLLGSNAAETEPVQVVNIANQGTLPFLPDDHVIEVPARIDATGAVAQSVATVEPLYAGLIAHVASYEQLALDAALLGGEDRVFAALLAHPLIGQVERARGLTDRLIAHNRDYLRWA